MKKLKNKIVGLYAFVMFYLPTMAYAKLSERGAGVSEEGGKLFGEFVFWTQILGAAIFIIAIISTAISKKNKQPLSWEGWGMICGAALFISMTLLGDTAGSIKGETVEINHTQSQSGF